MLRPRWRAELPATAFRGAAIDCFDPSGGAYDLINRQLGFWPRFWVVQRELQTELISQNLCGPELDG